jgi:hypothetical protein
VVRHVMDCSTNRQDFRCFVVQRCSVARVI